MRNECETLNPKVPFEEERKSDELFTSDVVDALDHAKKRSKPR